MYSELESKVRNARLTKTEKLIAEYMLANIHSICFMTATELAARVGVSDSSVIRLCRDLGYKGYTHLQNDLQRGIQNQVEHQIDTNVDVLLSPLEKLAKLSPNLAEADIVNQYLNLTIANIKTVVDANNLEKFEQIARILKEADNKYICGFRGCRGLADWMAFLLGHMVPNVYRNTHADSDGIEKMLDIKPNDCVVLFSYHRYSTMALEIAAIAKNAGAKLVVFTEKVTAPVAVGADAIMINDVKGLTFFNSHIGVMFGLELIVSILSKMIGQSNDTRLKMLEKHLDVIKLY